MIYWILHIAALLGLSYLSFRLLKSNLPSWTFWVALGLKLLAGIVLGLIFYEYYGTGDTITFFEAAKNLNSENLKDQPRTQFFITLLSPLALSTGGSYWLTSLWLSFISFLATWYATIIIIRLFPDLKAVISVSFLFIPSVVFWSSGILKDTIAFASLVVLVALTIKCYRLFSASVLEITIVILTGVTLFQIKHYLFITYLIFGGTLMASALFRRLNGAGRWAVASLILVLALTSTQFIHPYLEIDRIPWTLYENNRAILEKSTSEDQLDIVIENASWISVLSQVPGAFQAGLFRPSIYDPTPVWGWIHRIENLMLSILIIMSLILYFKLKPETDWMLFISSLLCILLLAVMLPLSTPNFGTLVRYKNVYTPYLFLISSILPYKYLTSKNG